LACPADYKNQGEVSGSSGRKHDEAMKYAPKWSALSQARDALSGAKN
jgi:hypothetical protein